MRRRAVALCAGIMLLAGFPAAAFAASAIQQVVAKTPAPVAGTNATFELAVSPNDGLAWDAGSYSVTVAATDANGTVIATSADTPGTDAIPVGQTAVVFVALPLPPAFSGTLTITSSVTHGTSTSTGDPLAIAVTAVAVAAAPAGPRAPKAVTGTLGTNFSFGPQTGQTATINLTGKLSDTASFTSSGGVATTPGANKPVISYQSPVLLVQAGTFSPVFDRDTFSGVTGAGADVKRSWGTAHSLNIAFIAGNEGTANPFDMVAVAYTLPLWNNPLTFTGGFETVGGPPVAGAYFLENGTFLGAGYDGHAATKPITYSAHYGLTEYFDGVSGTERTDRVYDTAFGVTIHKFVIAATYVRAGPYYATTSAPGITPDRETATLAVNVPIGVVQASASVNGYRDNLPDTPLTQATHYWTEMASLTLPLHNGDSIALQSTNGVQHQTGDPIAPFSGNDATTLAYTTKRGPYAFQYSFSSTNQRSNSGSSIHVYSDGITVGRTAFAGITLASGLNFTENEASMSSATGAMTSATASISIDHGPIVFSTQVNHGIAHMAVGAGSPPTTTYAYGLTLKPQRSGLSLSATMTENVGLVNSSTGALSLNENF